MSAAHFGLILILQMLLLLPLLWQLGRFLIDVRQLFSPTTVVAGGFAGLYVASWYLVSSHDRDAFLTVDGYLDLLLLAVFACYAFWAGFILGFGAASPRQRPCCPHTVRLYAIALIAIGFLAQAAFIARSGGFWAFYGAPHGTAGAWADTSAYLHSLPKLLFVAICLLWGMWVSRGQLGLLPGSALLAALAYSAFDAVVFGSRGDTIRLFHLLLLPPLFLMGRFRLRRSVLLLATSVVLVAIMIFPHVRDAVHLGAEKSLLQAVKEVFAEEAVSLDPSRMTGHELFYAAAVVEAASAQGAYHYGFGWAYPFVNLVPRAWWPDKPWRREWAISEPHLVQQHAGWSVAPGAAATGVADAFLAFSWLSIVVWLALGWWGGAIWARATATDDVLDVACLWAFLIIAVYFVNQSFHAAWHAWLFHMLPISFLDFLMRTMEARPELRHVAFASGRMQMTAKFRAPAP